MLSWGGSAGGVMTLKHVGWTLLIGGAAIQVAEAIAQADATLNNLQFQDTSVGTIVAPLEKVLPLSLGWTLIATGAVLVWIVPHLQKGV
jgi:hypothetical protein